MITPPAQHILTGSERDPIWIDNTGKCFHLMTSCYNWNFAKILFWSNSDAAINWPGFTIVFHIRITHLHKIWIVSSQAFFSMNPLWDAYFGDVSIIKIVWGSHYWPPNWWKITSIFIIVQTGDGFKRWSAMTMINDRCGAAQCCSTGASFTNWDDLKQRWDKGMYKNYRRIKDSDVINKPCSNFDHCLA